MKYKTLVNRIVTAVEAEHGEGGTKHQYIWQILKHTFA